MKKCYICGKPATKRQIAHFSIMPKDPQGHMDYKKGEKIYYFCDKHALHIESVKNKECW